MCDACVRATSSTPHHMVHCFPLSPTQDGDASGIGHSYSHLYDTTSCFLCQSNKSSMVSYYECERSHLKAQFTAVSELSCTVIDLFCLSKPWQQGFQMDFSFIFYCAEVMMQMCTYQHHQVPVLLLPSSCSSGHVLQHWHTLLT